MLTTFLAVGIVLGFYVGSYFLCVSPVWFGITRGDRVSVAPVYRYVPECLGATAPYLYRPIHLLDRACLRRSKWQTRPAKNGELTGGIAGGRRVLFSVPYTNAP